AAAMDGLDRSYGPRDARSAAERQRHQTDASGLRAGSRGEAGRGGTGPVREAGAPGRRPARRALRSLRGPTRSPRLARDVLGPTPAFPSERGSHRVAPAGASPELRRETHRESGAASHDRAPRAYRAPRIKKQ